jgi:hydrogenase small subunit
VWIRAQTCGGNTESLLRSPDPKIETMLLETISLEYHQSLLAAAGPGLDLARTTAMERYLDGYVAVVEGAIPDGENGAYCLVGGRPVKDIVREVAAGAVAVIAVGSCACDGGAPAASGGLTDAKGIRGLVGDTKLITLPGCPMNVVNLTAVIVHYLTFREWPPLDMMGRPLAAYGNLIHNQCERRPHFEFGEFVLSWGDEGAQRGWCLYKVGCKGPEAMGNCPTVRYGDGVSWNIRAGAGCVGCVTTDSWDQMGPAYRRLPSPVPFFPNLTTDMVGAAVVGGVAVVAGAHAVGMSTRYKRRARNARREALASADAGIAADAVALDSKEAAPAADDAPAEAVADSPATDAPAETGER